MKTAQGNLQKDMFVEHVLVISIISKIVPWRRVGQGKETKGEEGEVHRERSSPMNVGFVFRIQISRRCFPLYNV